MIDLSRFDNSWYDPGRSLVVRALWYFAGSPLVRCYWIPSSSLRRFVLGLFGARIGRGVVIRSGVRVKYPWRLEIGDGSWVGEDCWIDNLAEVRIGSNVCISQGAYLCTGNHDWSDPCFGLVVRPIEIQDGSWICAGSLIAPGVKVGRGAVACAGSVVTRDIPDYEIHAGNPARYVRQRRVNDKVGLAAQGRGGKAGG